MSKHLSLSHKRPLEEESHKRPREEESHKPPLEEESHKRPYEEESHKRPLEEESHTKKIKLTDLPTDLLEELIMLQAPQLRFASKIFYNKTKGWKLPPGAEYPSLTNKDMMCITHTQNLFSGQVMLPCPKKYFYDRRYQIHNGRDPYKIRYMSKVICFHCQEEKTLPSRPFYKRVKPLSGNYSSVISCCSKECNEALNTMISLTDVKQLKNKKIKIPSLGENYKDVEFYLASVIPQSDGEKLSYYFQGSLVNYQEISVWASFDQIYNYISTWSSFNEIEFLL